MQFSDAMWWCRSKSKMADESHIENRVFGYISAPYWPIKANFGREMKVAIYNTWPKLQFSKIQAGGGRHFENSFIHISAENYPILRKFDRQMYISIPMMKI